MVDLYLATLRLRSLLRSVNDKSALWPTLSMYVNTMTGAPEGGTARGAGSMFNACESMQLCCESGIDIALMWGWGRIPFRPGDRRVDWRFHCAPVGYITAHNTQGRIIRARKRVTAHST